MRLLSSRPAGQAVYLAVSILLAGFCLDRTMAADDQKESDESEEDTSNSTTAAASSSSSAGTSTIGFITTTTLGTTTPEAQEVGAVMSSVKLGMPAYSGTECEGAYSKVEECINGFFMEVNSLLVWPAGSYPAMVYKQADLNDFCGAKNNYLTRCLGDSVRQCTKDPRVQYMVQRVEGPANFTCGHGRRGFHERKHCLEHDILERCSEDHHLSDVVSHVAVLSTTEDREREKYQRCSNMESFINCVVADVAANCTRMDGYVEVLQRSWLQPLMEQIDCDIFSPGQCQRYRLEECVDPFLEQETFYLKNETTNVRQSRFLRGTYPASIYSDTIMLDYCRHYTEMRSCLYTARKLCEKEDKSISYTVDQLVNPAEYICDDAFHGFISHKHCLEPNMTKYCSKKYELFRAYDQAVKLVEHGGRYDDKEKTCSLIKDYLHCQKLVMNETCSGARELMDNVQRKWLKPLAKKLGCQLEEGMSAGEIAAIALGCLFGLALFISICGNFAARRPSKKTMY